MRISLSLDAGDGRPAGGGSGHGADDTEGVLTFEIKKWAGVFPVFIGEYEKNAHNAHFFRSHIWGNFLSFYVVDNLYIRDSEKSEHYGQLGSSILVDADGKGVREQSKAKIKVGRKKRKLARNRPYSSTCRARTSCPLFFEKVGTKMGTPLPSASCYFFLCFPGAAWRGRIFFGLFPLVYEWKTLGTGLWPAETRMLCLRFRCLCSMISE